MNKTTKEEQMKGREDIFCLIVGSRFYCKAKLNYVHLFFLLFSVKIAKNK